MMVMGVFEEYRFSLAFDVPLNQNSTKVETIVCKKPKTPPYMWNSNLSYVTYKTYKGVIRLMGLELKSSSTFN